MYIKGPFSREKRGFQEMLIRANNNLKFLSTLFSFCYSTSFRSYDSWAIYTIYITVESDHLWSDSTVSWTPQCVTVWHKFYVMQDLWLQSKDSSDKKVFEGTVSFWNYKIKFFLKLVTFNWAFFLQCQLRHRVKNSTFLCQSISLRYQRHIRKRFNMLIRSPDGLAD